MGASGCMVLACCTSIVLCGAGVGSGVSCMVSSLVGHVCA